MRRPGERYRLVDQPFEVESGRLAPRIAACRSGARGPRSADGLGEARIKTGSQRLSFAATDPGGDTIQERPPLRLQRIESARTPRASSTGCGVRSASAGRLSAQRCSVMRRRAASMSMRRIASTSSASDASVELRTRVVNWSWTHQRSLRRRCPQPFRSRDKIDVAILFTTCYGTRVGFPRGNVRVRPAVGSAQPEIRLTALQLPFGSSQLERPDDGCRTPFDGIVASVRAQRATAF